MKLGAAVIATAIVAALAPPMRDSVDQVAYFLAEMARRGVAADARAPAPGPTTEEVADAAATLRSIFENHPKQKALYRSPAKRKATRKTRRAGATAGGVRELLARALEIPGFRATYVTSTRLEARDRAWRNDTQSGFVDVLRKVGSPVPSRGVETILLGGIRIEIREQEVALDFSNGSRIDLFGADNLRAIGKKRGNAKHVFWIDEAQDFRFLDQFYKGTVIPALADFDGECWFSGTPGRDIAGMFYEVARDDEDALVGWEVHEIAVVDNPFFGCVVWDGGLWYVVDNMRRQVGPFPTEDDAEQAAVKIRWENTAGKAIRENNLKESDPDVQREWFAKWVKGDLAYVYPVHTIPKHELVFASQRLIDNPLVGTHPRYASHPRWYDHQAALADLPLSRKRRQYQWLFALGADFGYYPDPFALVVWGFCRELPDVYEMFSWKHTRVITDDQAVYLGMLWRGIDRVVVLVGDPAGKQDDFEAWRQRLQLPMEEANKKGKNALEEFLANAIRRGHVHYRENSPLLLEHKHLVYLPQKPGKPREADKHRRAVDGIVYGDHCSDAARYSYAHVDHYLYKAPDEKPKPGSIAAMAEAERELEQDVDDVEAARKAAGVNKDDEDSDGWSQIDGGLAW